MTLQKPFGFLSAKSIPTNLVSPAFVMPSSGSAAIEHFENMFFWENMGLFKEKRVNLQRLSNERRIR
jgi:hypothetical protein